MILGAVLPDEHLSWYATKVTAKTIPPLKVPAKGKAVTNAELRTTLDAALRSRGAQAKNLLKAFLL